MFDSLCDYDNTYKVVNLVLAEEVTSNADATEWTVRVRPDVLWHDGKPLTADDVVYSYRRIVNPKAPGIGVGDLLGLKSANIVKIDARTVKFRYDSPNVLFGAESLASRSCRVVPVDFDPKKPIGTGPFKLTSFTPGNQFVLSAFKDYFGGAPYLDQITMIEFADPTARFNALQGGTIDAMCNLNGSQVPVVKSAAGLGTLVARTGAWVLMGMRMDLKPFNDARVRQAFRLIADRPQIIQNAYAGMAWIGNDMYSPFDPGYPKQLPQRQQDLEQARSLLKQAGYDNDLTVQLQTSDAIGAGAVAQATAFAEQAKGAGVNVKVSTVTSGVLWGDMYLKWPFAMDYYNTRNYLMTAVLTAGTYNALHAKDAKWDALIREASGTMDDAKRNELVTEAETIEYNTGGYLIAVYKNQADAYSTKLHGLVEDASGIPLGRYRFKDAYLTS